MKRFCSSHGALFAIAAVGTFCAATVPRAFGATAADGYAYSTLLAFGFQSTSSPPTSVIVGKDGDLYGTMHGGVLFRFSPSAKKYTPLVTFNSPAAPGRFPGGIVLDSSSGDIYGTTLHGGVPSGSFNGTLFRYSTTTDTYSTLVNFNTPGVTGMSPQGDLTIGSDGSIYGTTQFGSGSDGTLFRYTPLTNTFATLVNFGVGNASGGYPNGSLTLASDGSLFGTTYSGGTNGRGTLFRYTPLTNTFATLINFGAPGAPGENPVSGVTIGSDGNLYGTTNGGGFFDEGTMYRYDLSTGEYATVVKFRSPEAPGYVPRGDLTLGLDGSIYGTTLFGTGPGTTPGTLYRYTPSTNTFSTIVEFGPGESGPIGNLQVGSDGSLYGATGGGNGTLFRLSVTVPEASTFALALSALGVVALCNRGGAVVPRRRKA